MNSKGRSEEVRLPDLKSDFLLENGPITRAAKNTEIKVNFELNNLTRKLFLFLYFLPFVKKIS